MSRTTRSSAGVEGAPLLGDSLKRLSLLDGGQSFSYSGRQASTASVLFHAGVNSRSPCRSFEYANLLSAQSSSYMF
ncbi:hypothetical protein GLW04_01655 [Halobacillus litoralis]|uniref:Uncharacterized protein n=1 Tax=Halobacillus litoralis TaxID=45668 RepID=A0A845DMJ1_9BACI|nr:hypothetical protein [Halobacillus litoralis]MYL18573.1 hypothetical protein [Halobacillus litoralis]